MNISARDSYCWTRNITLQMLYVRSHFSIKLDQDETLNPGDAKLAADFVTVYNFFGFVEGSVKSPAGWNFSSEKFGRTPTLNGYPMVLPVDVPNTPNLTWTVTKPVASGL